MLWGRLSARWSCAARAGQPAFGRRSPMARKPSWHRDGEKSSPLGPSPTGSRQARISTFSPATTTTARWPLGPRAPLTISDTDAALVLEARIEGGTSWAQDFLAAHRAGLVRGLSPGFRVQSGGERIEQRGAGLLRTITRAALFELSAVTVPAYPEAQIEARSWETHQDRQPFRGAAFHPQPLEALTWA